MSLLPPKTDPRRARVLVVFGVVIALGVIMAILGVVGGLIFEQVYLHP